MGLFSNILAKLGIKKKPEAVAAPPPIAKPSTPINTGKPGGSTAPKPSVVQKDDAFERITSQVPGAAVAPISAVDVVSKLEGLAAANPAKLNWKTSIVDLLKLLDLDSSFESRKELAVELGCPPEMMGDSAKMNTWLHKEVLRQIAKNGGNIPKELMD